MPDCLRDNPTKLQPKLPPQNLKIAVVTSIHKQPPDTSLSKPSSAISLKLEREILSVQEALIAKEPIQDSVHFTVKSKDEKRDWRQKKTQDSRTEAVAKKKRS